PEYMSPEQASGEPHLSNASDIYSLACVVYEMLAGTPPVRGSGSRATIAKQVTDVPRPLRALRPDAPAHVERTLARALAKDPGERFPTVPEFVAALQREQPSAGAIGSVIGRSIADTLRVTSFADFEAPSHKRYTESIAAYGLYLRGRFAWNTRTQEGITEAIRYFEQAIAEDPRYAPAYTGLADSYALQLD